MTEFRYKAFVSYSWADAAWGKWLLQVLETYRTPKAYPVLPADPRFVRVCARLGLVEYWLVTGHWPDCADEVPYEFRAEAEGLHGHPKDGFLA